MTLLQSQIPREESVIDLLLVADCCPNCTVTTTLMVVWFWAIFCPSAENLLFFGHTFPRLVLDRIYPVSLRLDLSPAGMLSCCYFCLGKFQSSRTEYLTSSSLLSLLSFESSCLISCIILLLLLHIASSSNISCCYRACRGKDRL